MSGLLMPIRPSMNARHTTGSMATRPRVERITRRTAVVGLALGPLLLVACSNGTGGEAPASTGREGEPGPVAGDDFLADHGLQDMDARGIIEHLEALPLDQRPRDLMASVRPSQLLMSDAAGNELALPIEGDFYLSTAPYVDGTHECWFHSLTTCTGELQEVDVEVTVTDAADGTVIHEGTERTNPNGFFGLWLPRGGSFEMVCTVDGKSSTTAIATATEEDATCLTTAQLV